MKKFVFLSASRLICFFVLAIITGCARQASFVEVKIDGGLSGNVHNEIVATPTPSASSGRSPRFAGEAGFAPELASPPRAGGEVIEVPSKIELRVTFASQAPFANWDELHQEACEEASMIVAAKYFLRQPLDEKIMEEEIQKLVKWEEENGYQVDLTAAEAVAVLEKYFGLRARVEKEVTVDRIKYELSLGNLIIAPAAGRQLGNPYFRAPGPIYHMLVIKGYDSDEFITNDVGTKRGDGFKYKYNQLISAIHDWDHDLAQDGMTDEEIGRGEKVMIAVEK